VVFLRYKNKTTDYILQTVQKWHCSTLLFIRNNENFMSNLNLLCKYYAAIVKKSMNINIGTSCLKNVIYRIGIWEQNIVCVCVCVWKRTIHNSTLSQGGPLCHNKITLSCKMQVLTAEAFLYQKICHVLCSFRYLVYTHQILKFFLMFQMEVIFICIWQNH
jgi:hypothetical protein